MQSQYSIDVVDIADSRIKDVFLNGGHIGQVGEQRNSKGKPYSQPRYWWSKTVPSKTSPGEVEEVSEGGFTSLTWAVEALVRVEIRKDQFCIQDVTDRLETELLGGTSKATMILGSDGHVSSVVVPKGEFAVSWTLTPKRKV